MSGECLQVMQVNSKVTGHHQNGRRSMIRLRAQLVALFILNIPFGLIPRTCQMGRATGTLPNFICRENVLETK
jgi:hypothetical protein